MSEISELLQTGIDRKGWKTVTEAARKMDVERTFLSRLLNGDPPRLKRGGSRGKVEPDKRYHKMAEALELGDEFLELVARELRARSPSRNKKAAETRKEAQRVDHQSGLADESLKEGYPDLWEIAADQGELRGEVTLLELAENCMASLGVEDVWIRRINKFNRPEYFFEPRRHNRLGKLPGSSIPSSSIEASTCRQIAEAITDEPEFEKHARSSPTRVRIASFFLELACCRFPLSSSR